MELKRYRKYDKEFKRDAVKLVVDQNRTVISVAEDLGIVANSLYKWVKQYLEDGKNCFPGKGYLKPHEAETMRLKKELRDVTEERDILKKAMAVFSRHVK